MIALHTVYVAFTYTYSTTVARPTPKTATMATDDEHSDSDSSSNENGDNEVAPSTAAAAADETPTAADDDDSSSDILTKSTFASLNVVDVLCKACESLNWKTATQIQAQVLPEALQGNDIIGLAETGSGKTGAFVLPILQGLLNNTHARNQTLALILSPTRELAYQILEVVQALGQCIAATSTCIVGGVDRASQAIALARHPHIVVATPGRLLDHLQDTKGFHLRHVQYLVLDEADRMLSMDFEQELHNILDNLPSTQRQTFLFSATMTSQVEKLQRASLQANAVKIQVSQHKFVTPKQLLQHYLFIPAKYKDCYLTYLLSEHFSGKSILVFGATCNNVQRLTLMLRNLGFPAIALHGQMNQPKRLGALNKFRSQQRTIMVCTDVAARGLDLPCVDAVINYDLPGHGKEYIHRTGTCVYLERLLRVVGGAHSSLPFLLLFFFLFSFRPYGTCWQIWPSHCHGNTIRRGNLSAP